MLRFLAKHNAVPDINVHLAFYCLNDRDHSDHWSHLAINTLQYHKPLKEINSCTLHENISHHCDNLLCIFMEMEQHTGCCSNISAGNWGIHKLYPHLGIASAPGIVWGNFVARVSGKNSTSNPAMSDKVPASNAPPAWVGN